MPPKPPRQFRPTVIILLAALSLGLGACDTLWPSSSPPETPVAAAAPPAPATAGTRHQARQRPAVALDPGCPLGSEAVLGLNLAEKGCNSKPYTQPRGPVGIPATP